MATIQKHKLYGSRKHQLGFLYKIFGPHPRYFVLTLSAAIIIVLGFAYVLGTLFEWIYK